MPKLDKIPDRYPGAVIGRLTLISPELKLVSNGKRRTYWNCMCSCGKKVQVRGDGFVEIFSCGCKRKEHLISINTLHGMCTTKTYLAWGAMRQRCMNKNTRAYAHYGGRGITICDRWLKFENFLEDMGERSPGMELERKDNNLGYSPSNCKWATRKEQMRNRRNTIMVLWRGEGKPVVDVAIELGITREVAIRKFKHEVFRNGDIAKCKA